MPTTHAIAGPTWLHRPLWCRFRPLQVLVLALALAAPTAIAAVVSARLAGLVDTDTMVELSLAAGENPGMVTFGALFLCTPVQRLTGRSQVRVRKALGIVFFLLAGNNLAMFVIPHGVAAAVGGAVVLTGLTALVLAAPLFATSSRWSQHRLGRRRWLALHRLTYLVAAVLVGHVVAVGDIGPGAVLIGLGAVARIPAVARWLDRRAARRTRSGDGAGGPEVGDAFGWQADLGEHPVGVLSQGRARTRHAGVAAFEP